MQNWLRNSPDKRYQWIRICLTGEVETPSSPIRSQDPDTKHPGGMCAATAHVPMPSDGVSGREGSHTPCILDLLMDSKELSSISDCFVDQNAIKTPKLNTI